MVSPHDPMVPPAGMSVAGVAAESSMSPSGRLLTVALTMRLVLFAVFQAIVAVVLFAGGVPEPWSASAAWWPLTATATSVVTFVFLRWRARVEGFSLTAFYRPVRPGVARDVLLALAVAFVGGGIAVGASILLAPIFFTEPTTANALLIQPLPTWAAVLAVALFPVSVALTELPLYFGYVQRRLGARTGSAAAAVLIPAVFLSLQHATLPLIFDLSFIGWRASMFLGFALVLAWSLWKRPRLMPYLIVVHFLLDLQAAISILQISG
ncbi:hypothetical protein MRBLMI12_002290 [Microbacterium sp. LMI12-1-1.1]|uniref:CPBP family glutamic-type intramembrane protease n=1 Tax=Microbacterium sp. LMI12-1-1.1 TaxID=3135225 RepID=UPI003412618E